VRTFTPVVLLLLMMAGPVLAQSREELLQENQELKAHVKALEAALAEKAGKVPDAKSEEKPDGKDGNGKHGHGHGACKEPPEDRFDFCRPFKKGDDDKDKPSCLDGHDGKNGDDKEKEIPGHDRDESFYGYPFFHPVRTENAWLERELRIEFARIKGAGGRLPDSFNIDFELNYALNNRIGLVLSAPVIWLNPNGLPEAGGVGDLELGFRFVAFNAKHDLLTFGLNVITPTGDEKRLLGLGHTELEPELLNLTDFGHGWLLNTELALRTPVSTNDVPDRFVYNFALGKTILATEHGKHFQWFTPFVELNGTTFLNGPQATGVTAIDVTPGFHVEMGKHLHYSVGYSIPVTGPRFSDYQVRFDFFYSF
jgi:hypothetical protein